MLSTFVLMPPAGDAPPALGALVRTLAALVPAIVEGLVRDVTVIAPRADEGVRRIADHAGCELVENADFDAALREGIARARAPLVFLLRAGAFLDRAFLDEAARQFGPERRVPRARSPLIEGLLQSRMMKALAFLDWSDVGQDSLCPSGRPLLIREAPDGLVTRVLPDLAPVAGVIADKAALAHPFKDFEALVRRQRTAQTLQSRASMAR